MTTRLWMLPRPTLRPLAMALVLAEGIALMTLGAPAAPCQVDPQTGLDMVVVGAPGNAADTNGLGAVAAPYRLGRHELTNTAYLAFLDAMASDDTHGLYDELMTDSDRGGILRAGSPGSYTYSLKPDFDDKPVNGIDWYDAARYCNWLHNGQPIGAQTTATTEDGVYDLSLPGAQIARQAGATWFLPSHDEWYKAAYFDPLDPGADGNGTLDYWTYPTRSDALPGQASADASGDVTNPGANVANADKGADWNGENGNVTSVGGCAALGPWGTLDQGGNVGEMTDTPATPIPGPPVLPTRRMRGGDFANSAVLMGSSTVFSLSLNMEAAGANVGLRVGSFAPWFDVGGALAGAAGDPLLTGEGMTTEGTAVALSLSQALAGADAALVLGFSSLQAPLKGGTLVPFPDIILFGLSTDGAGALEVPAVWPPGLPAQSSLWAQFWITDPAGPKGFAASNGLLVRTP
jgi:formylglycine-generating enzyme required for sulfatase activity